MTVPTLLQRFIRPAFLMAAIALLATSTATAQVLAGKEFVVALPAFNNPHNGIRPGMFYVTVMCTYRTNITVRWRNGDLITRATVNAGDRLTLQPPQFDVQNLMQRYPFDATSLLVEPNDRSLVVTADQPVSVFAFYDDYKTYSKTALYNVPPVEAYDTSYVGKTFVGAVSDHTGFLITASEDGTRVEFTTTVDWENGNPDGVKGVPATITMKRHQVFQLLSAKRGADLSGSTIRSNKPIGVIAFNLATVVPFRVRPEPDSADSTPCEPDVGPDLPPPTPEELLALQQKCEVPTREGAIADVLPPLKDTGSLFYTAPFRGQDTSYVIVLALHDSTKILVNGVPARTRSGGDSLIMRLKSHDSIPVWGATKIETSKPVLAMQLGRSGDYFVKDTTYVKDGRSYFVERTLGAPFMAQLPPVRKYARKLHWTGPLVDPRYENGTNNAVTLPWYHYVLITAPTSAARSVRLGDDTVAFQYAHVDGKYVSAIVPVLPKQYVLVADEPIMAIPYGLGWNDGYGTIASTRPFSHAVIQDTIRAVTCDSLLRVQLPIGNAGSVGFLIDSLRLSGIAGDVLSPNRLPQTILPDREFPLIFTLRLTEATTYNGTLRIYSTADNRKLIEIPLRITRDSARLERPARVDFGSLPSSRTTADTTITLRNTGTDTLRVTQLTLTDPRFVILSPTAPIVLGPGDSTRVQVRFTPRANTPEQGTLEILTDRCDTRLLIPFSGFRGAGPVLGIVRTLGYPATLCAANTTRDTTITLRNTGGEPLLVDSARIAGTHATSFALTTLLDNVTVLPGDSLKATVRYAPQGFGAHNATLNIWSTAVNVASPVDVALSGRTDTAALNVAERTIDLGQILLCDADRQIVLPLENTGTVELTVTSIDGLDDVLSGAASFPMTIGPGQTQEIVLDVDPSTVDAGQTITRQLRIAGDPCAISETLTVTAQVIAPALAVDDESIAFDALYLCDNDSTTATFSVTNTGPVADTLLRLTQSGDDAFRVDPLDYPLVLEPGASQEVTVTFRPTAARSFLGELTFTWGPCNGATTVELAGTALGIALELEAQTLDFGQVDIATGAVRRTLRVRNTGTAPRTITTLDLGGNADLDVITDLPITIDPAGEALIEVDYDPSAIGMLSIEGAIIVQDPCGESIAIAVAGEAIGEETIEASLTLDVPIGLSEEVDRLVDLPIRISNGENLAAAAPSAIELTLAWRYSMLNPISVAPVAPGLTASIIDSRIDNGERLVRLRLEGTDWPANGVLAQVRALVLLGDAMTTPITIDSVAIVSPPKRLFRVTLEEGSFTAEGICLTDGERLVRRGGAVKLAAPRPNPASESVELEYAVEEGGYLELVVLDAVGLEVARLAGGDHGAGVYRVRLAAGTLPSGLYFCELRTADHRVRQTLVIAR